MVLQLLHPRFGLFAPFAAVFVSELGVALLSPKKRGGREEEERSQRESM